MWKIIFFLSIFSIGFGQNPTPSQALDKLVQGNVRFATKKPLRSTDPSKRRKATIDQQNPVAVIVACSDSRVAPEILFDAEIGDLFVIRLAGNITGDLGNESVIYASSVLKAPLILVMGHQNCGAVDAVIQNKAKAVPAIAKKIEPAVEMERQSGDHSLLKRSIEQNARNVAKDLLQIQSIQQRAKEGSVAIHASYYDFDTGKVTLLD